MCCVKWQNKSTIAKIKSWNEDPDISWVREYQTDLKDSEGNEASRIKKPRAKHNAMFKSYCSDEEPQSLWYYICMIHKTTHRQHHFPFHWVKLTVYTTCISQRRPLQLKRTDTQILLSVRNLEFYYPQPISNFCFVLYYVQDSKMIISEFLFVIFLWPIHITTENIVLTSGTLRLLLWLLSPISLITKACMCCSHRGRHVT